MHLTDSFYHITTNKTKCWEIDLRKIQELVCGWYGIKPLLIPLMKACIKDFTLAYKGSNFFYFLYLFTIYAKYTQTSVLITMEKKNWNNFERAWIFLKICIETWNHVYSDKYMYLSMHILSCFSLFLSCVTTKKMKPPTVSYNHGEKINSVWVKK